MKKKAWLITIVLLLVLFLGIGVKNHMNKEAQKKEIIEAEKLIAQDILKKYQGIHKITFNDLAYSSESGAYDIYFNINEDKNYFFYNYVNKNDFRDVGEGGHFLYKYFPKKSPNSKEPSTKDVKIKYYDKVED
ncbi:hypothetical protein [Ligilactobacillus acidipiscis]|uniref:hypothetical protein n=1 Tax=Ligilactobacillus acidipiscis TaxID=89059 RepID=UPI0023F65CF5|nr:hypothetical protein [Ligilactobacillus acidipiscis]WEV57027.1 hypothetical protein OZX66_00355 [Ligilactobacillus acidipiscis]